MTLVRHNNGRIHVGVLFQEASNQCTDDCGTGKVCFGHMVERLKEVADYIQTLERKLGISEGNSIERRPSEGAP
jgi:hypothetical protein